MNDLRKKLNEKIERMAKKYAPINIDEQSGYEEGAHAMAEQLVKLVEALEYIGERMIAGKAGMYGDESLSPDQHCYQMEDQYIQVYQKALTDLEAWLDEGE